MPSPTPAVGGKNLLVEGLVDGAYIDPGLKSTVNPLVLGIKNSFGQVLGASIQLPQTSSQPENQTKLASGNKLKKSVNLFIPKIGFSQPVFRGEIIGSQLLIGDQEVLETNINGGYFIYAHNTTADISQIRYLENDDVIFRQEQGRIITYRVVMKIRISGNYNKIFDQLDENSLLLVTCDYWDPSLRLVIKAVKETK